MPWVMNPASEGPDPTGSAVSPGAQPLPWPRVSITKWAMPAEAQSRWAWGRLRPPPYPMNSTSTGRGSVVPAGMTNQPLTGWPPKPANVTSYTSTVVRPRSAQSSKRASRSWVLASSSVPDQNASKSSGSTDRLR